MCRVILVFGELGRPRYSSRWVIAITAPALRALYSLPGTIGGFPLADLRFSAPSAQITHGNSTSLGLGVRPGTEVGAVVVACQVVLGWGWWHLVVLRWGWWHPVAVAGGQTAAGFK